MTDPARPLSPLALAILAATPDEWGSIEALDSLITAGLIRRHADGRWERTDTGRAAHAAGPSGDLIAVSPPPDH